MQSIYAMHQKNGDDIEKEEKFLLHSIDSVMDLYLIMLTSLTEIRKKEIVFLQTSSKKHLATPEERNPNNKFINNFVLQLLENSTALSLAIEKRKITNWSMNDDYILILWNEVKNSDLFKTYMKTPVTNFEEDKQFVIDMFTELIAPNDKLYEYLEDNKLTWIDDIPLVNTQILKQLKQINKNDDSFSISKLYKDQEDKEFVSNLFRKTILNETELAKEYIDKTPNWDADRIAEIDTIILKMAICEFLKFPSIPLKVTINEYLELAKEYSTPKSSIFINGILDNLIKDFQAADKIKKTGRGLM
jgi:N utilization substance protein B